MPDFTWSAVDPEGRERRGRLDAASADAARAKLAERRFYVVSCDPAPQRAPVAMPFRRAPRLSTKQLTLFTRQLSSLVGVSPLEEALRTCARQSEKVQTRAILDNVHAGVVEGQRLSAAMRREERSFPPLYRAMISAGESSGTLGDIAERLANLLERQAAMRGKLISALAYPIALALVALLVVSGLMVFVVPRVVEQFDGIDQQLPLITRIVMGISGFMAGWWWAILIAIVLAATGFARALRNPGFRLWFDGRLLRLPLIGRLLRDLNAARLARTLATMVASRLPLLEGLRLTAPTITNQVLARAANDIVESVRGGGSLSGAMRTTGVFPPLLVYLTASGESAGELDTMLERASEYLEREFDNFTSAALSLLEPLIIVVMGGVVAIIILSILLPILQIQNLAGG